MFHTKQYPVIVDASEIGPDPCRWANANAARIEETLTSAGAMLFKRTTLDTPAKLEEFVRQTSSEMPDFKEESSPRTPVEGRVLTSTDYPNRYPIQFHTEYSYAMRWPMKLYFCCFQPPDFEGETPIADTRLVLSNMRSSTREMFERKGILYIRNYRPNAGVSWQRAFSTDDRKVVERICAEAMIECEWRSGGVLRTRQYGDAIVAHPKTGQPVWFNHAFFFNVRAIKPPSLREVFLTDPADDPLSTNTLFGDGSPIGAETIEELRSLYARASVRHPWERGDLLLIDNMLSAHARAAYKGKRKIVVVMADSCVRSRPRASSEFLDTKWSGAKKPASEWAVNKRPALVDTT
jgi:alpha-ketoglutarate-dependent taurine dioxygenase